MITSSGVSAALSKAASISRWTVNMCDNFVANVYGQSASGYNTALDHWNAIPSQYKHPGDTNAPAGALVFWGGGDGHVAVSLGNGQIRTTDLGGLGTVTTQPFSAVGSKWGKPYLGWSQPYFGGHVLTAVGPYTGSNTTLTSAIGSSTSGFDISSLTNTGLQDSISSEFSKSLMGVLEPVLKVVWYAAEIVIGGACLVIGAMIMVNARAEKSSPNPAPSDDTVEVEQPPLVHGKPNPEI